METIKERADRIAKKRLETIEFYDTERPEIRVRRDHWIPRTLRGDSTAGKIAGITADIAVAALPLWLQRIIGIIRKHTTEDNIMPARVKPYLTQLSTWEGIAAVVGAIGITIYPAAAVEISAGVFGIIGGIELWKQEREAE